MRFPWQSSFVNNKKTTKTQSRPAKKHKKKFLPTLELLEKRELMATAIINVTILADTAGLTGLPTLSSASGGVDTYTGSLREAINLANQNGFTAYTINLSGGATYDITLSGGGEDLNAGGDFDIRSAEPVTIQTASGGAAIVSGGSGNAQDRVFDIGPKGNVTFSDVQITGGSTSGAGGGIRSAPGSIVLLENTSVEYNTASVGGGIAAGYAGMNLSGGTLHVGSATLTLAALSAGSGGSLTLSGGSSFVSDNQANGASGGIGQGGGIASSGESLVIINAQIDYNTAGNYGPQVAGQGAGVFVTDPNHNFTSGTHVTLTDATISDNTAIGASGGAAGEGGGLFLSRLDTASISGGSIDGNYAKPGASGGQGGGVYLTSSHAVSGGLGGTVLFNETSIQGNTAQGGFSGGGTGGQGGGMWIGNAEIVQVSGGGGSSIAGNVARATPGPHGGGGKGGGIYATGAMVTLTSVTIGGPSASSDNNVGRGGSSGGSGGGIYFANLGEKISGGTSSTLTVISSTIQNNEAENSQPFHGKATDGGEGGGIFLKAFGAYSGGTQATITGTNIVDNQALGGFSGGTGGEGGGLYVNPNVSVFISGGSISANTVGGAGPAASGGASQSGHGGGIYADGAILQITNVTIGGTSAGNRANAGGGGDSVPGGAGSGIYFTDLGKILSGGGNSAILSTLNISGGCVADNVAWGGSSGGAGAQGAGIFVQAFGAYSGGAQVNLTSVSISGNIAEWASLSSGGTAMGGEGGGLYIGDNLSVSISGGSICGNTAFGGDGSNSTGGKGAGIFADGAIDKLTNTTVAGNLALGTGNGPQGGSGGGIYFKGLGEVLLHGTTATLSSLTISGGSFSDNVASGGNYFSGGSFSGGKGGAIYAQSFGAYSGGVQVTVTGTCITGNTAGGGSSGGEGGGLFVGNAVAVSVSGGSISGNTAGAASEIGSGAGAGGGVFADGAIVKLTNTAVNGNTAQAAFLGSDSEGGGIYFQDLGKILSGGASPIRSSLVISGGSVSDNVAEGGGDGSEGGGIFAQAYGVYSGGTQMSITGTCVAGNTAEGGFGGSQGGGIFINENLSVTLTNATIASNTAEGGFFIYTDGGAGGGIFATGSMVALTSTTVCGNIAEGGEAIIFFGGGAGGGIFAADSVLTLTDSTIDGNTAGGGTFSLFLAVPAGEDSAGPSGVEPAFSDGGVGGQGGGIFVSGLGQTVSGTTKSTLTISGGCINYNLAQGGNYHTDNPFSGGGFAQGGGIYASAAGSYSGGTQVSITGAAIRGNTAQGGYSGGQGGEGGGIFLGDNLSVNLSNATIASNTAGGAVSGGGGEGGGIFSRDDILVLTGTTVGGASAGDGCGNFAQGGYSGGAGGQGGGIYAIGLGAPLSGGGTIRSSLTVSGGAVNNNLAGGGDFVPLSGGQFTLPAGAGGGIYARSHGGFSGGTQVSIASASISGNTAQGGTSGGGGGAGGGIFLQSGLSATITGSTIAGNSATGATGGSTSFFDFSIGEDFNYNQGGVGGGIFASTDVLKLVSDTIGGTSASNANVAGQGSSGGNGTGGGIYDVGLGNFIGGVSGTATQASLSISGGSVVGNLAEGGAFGGGGGGIYASAFSGGNAAVVKPALPEAGYAGGTQVTINNVLISGNTAQGGFSGGGGGSAGGGILLNGPLSATISNSTITSNTSGASTARGGGGGAGGGIAMFEAIVQLTSTNVGVSGGGNFAGGDAFSRGSSGAGGGIFALGLGEEISSESLTLAQSSLSISGGSVSYNTAQGGSYEGGSGGGIFAEGGLSGGYVLPGTQMSITNAAVSKNSATGGAFGSGSGGGMYLAYLTAAISGGSISGNTAGATSSGGGGGGEGGGIFMDALVALKLTNANVSSNLAAGNILSSSGGGGAGGGIFAEHLGQTSVPAVVPATATVSGGFISSLAITGSTISGNSATNGFSGGGVGGGIDAIGDFSSGATFTMLNTSVTNNYAGSASGGTSSSYEAGAGINIIGINASIFACLIANNRTDGSSRSVGGGIYIADAAASITNTTLAFNSAGYGSGGGLYTTNGSTVNLVNDTIAYNVACHGGGVYRYGPSGDSQTSVLNTIIAENLSKPSGGSETDVSGFFDDLGHNLIGTNVGATASFTESTYVAAGVGGNPNIHHTANLNGDFVGGASRGALSTYEVGLATALAINQLPAPFGVPLTLTLALEHGSLAIGGGLDNSTVLALLTAPGGTNPQDQRGPNYIRTGEVDIGAFQKAPTNTPNTVGTGGDNT